MPPPSKRDLVHRLAEELHSFRLGLIGVRLPAEDVEPLLESMRRLEMTLRTCVVRLPDRDKLRPSTPSGD